MSAAAVIPMSSLANDLVRQLAVRGDAVEQRKMSIVFIDAKSADGSLLLPINGVEKSAARGNPEVGRLGGLGHEPQWRQCAVGAVEFPCIDPVGTARRVAARVKNESLRDGNRDPQVRQEDNEQTVYQRASFSP